MTCPNGGPECTCELPAVLYATVTSVPTPARYWGVAMTDGEDIHVLCTRLDMAEDEAAAHAASLNTGAPDDWSYHAAEVVREG